MKKRVCNCCKSAVELKDHYKKSEEPEQKSFLIPCNTCKNNHLPDDEFPCYFCINFN